MKKHILTIQAFTIMTVLLLIGSTVSAQTSRDTNSFIKSTFVKHITEPDNKISYNVKISNEQAEKFSLTIKDDMGAVLFQQVYQDKVFNKKFQFEEMNEQGTVTIIVKSLKDNTSQSFEINTVTRVVNDVVIHRF